MRAVIVLFALLIALMVFYRVPSTSLICGDIDYRGNGLSGEVIECLRTNGKREISEPVIVSKAVDETIEACVASLQNQSTSEDGVVPRGIMVKARQYAWAFITDGRGYCSGRRLFLDGINAPLRSK